MSSQIKHTIQLQPRKKILDEIKKFNPKIKLIAFKAEYEKVEKNLINKAFKRLKEAKADVIIANDVSRNNRGFEADTNEVFVVFKNSRYTKIPLASKQDVAREIVDLLKL